MRRGRGPGGREDPPPIWSGRGGGGGGRSAPAGVLTNFDRFYPFAGFGVLAEVDLSWKKLISSRHERGFALHSMRSLELTRLYLQVARDEEIDNWPDERIWDELER